MSVHGHRYWGRSGNGGQMAAALSLSWLNIFPGGISARGVIPVWRACDSSSFCSCHPDGHSKDQFTASIYISSLVCLLWKPASPGSLSSPHPSLSCKLLRLPLSLPKPSQLSPEGTLSIPPWQSGSIYYSHLQPADIPSTFHFTIIKLL